MTAIPKLSPPEKAAQLVFPGFTFGLDDPASAERLVDLGVGGFCLYGGGVGEVADFTHRLQARARVPLLFCADYEDGTAAHVAGGTAFPPNMAIGASGSEGLAYQKALITGLEARALGVRWVLAPVLDLATEPSNPIVNARAFGEDPELAGRLGAAYMKGCSAANVLSCAKHFPGHGGASRDSHLELPVLRRTRAQLAKREWVPFRRTADAADAVMMAHLLVPGLGGAAGTPTSLSKPAVSVLRGALRYAGLVVTDALTMRAVSASCEDPEEICLAALAAGNDVLLVPADPQRVAAALPERARADWRLKPLVEAAFLRLMAAKAACGLGVDRGRWPEESAAAVGKPRHRELAERMAAECLCWVAGRAARGVLAAGGSIRYLEPEAESARDWEGAAFAAELKSHGVDVRPYAPDRGGAVLVAAFVRPRAYSGKIELSEEERRAAERALAERKDGVLVSFGSPFVFDQLRSWKTGLCAFGATEASQRAAARVLLGRAPAPGRMPVTLECMTSGRRRRASRGAG